MQRLKRFKEKVQGQAPVSGALTRQFEKRASLCSCEFLPAIVPTPASHELFCLDVVWSDRKLKVKISDDASFEIAAFIRSNEIYSIVHAASLSLQMPGDEQESHTLLEPELFQKSETNARKIDGCPSPLPVPRLPHQQKKKNHCTENVEKKAKFSPTISAFCTRTGSF